MRYMINLSDELVEKLDDVAGKTGNTRSGVVHIALIEFLERYSQFFGFDLSAYNKKKATRPTKF